MYSYTEERPKLFTEKGQVDLLKVRDRALKLLAEAGAVKMYPLLNCLSGDAWYQMAVVDRLVELGDLREITDGRTAGQDRIFVGRNR